ncbi:MAG: NAD(P)/FAD-dependent oxidoreductase [Haloarculaceae archaeon]
MHAVVVGGGLAGLVAARHLAEAGVEVELFERRPEVGGRVRSVHEDGFTVDRGFQVLFTAYPAARRELDYGALDLRSFAPGATIARPGHRSTLADPLRDPGSAFETLANRDVGLGDKLQLFRLQRDLRGRSEAEAFRDDDVDIATYLDRRGFSRAFVENFAAPFYGGITLDRSLSTSAGVFEFTFRMLAEGRTAVPAAGMGAVPAQLAASARDAGATVECDATVDAVSADDGSVAVAVGGETVAADAAVVAADPATAGDLTGVDTPTEARGCVTVFLSLPGHAELDTGRRIVLNAADDRPNTVAPMSAVAPEHAPEDRQLLSATFLGEQAASDDDLAAEVRDALAAWYPEHSFGDVDLVHVERVPFAQFAQPPGFRADLPAVTAPEGPVYLAGDYTAWSSIHGALESGRRAAEAALHGT